MSVYNIVRKRQVLETNLKFEEITNFYRIFSYILTLLWWFLSELQCFLFANLISGWWAYSIGDMLERNLFFRYPGLGTVLHWRDTEMKNLLPTLPYFRLWQIIILHGMDSTISFYVCIKDECRDFTFLSTSYWDKSWTLSFVGVESTHGWQSLIRCQTNIL